MALLRSRNKQSGAPIAIERLEVDVQIHGLLAETILDLTLRNDSLEVAEGANKT